MKSALPFLVVALLLACVGSVVVAARSAASRGALGVSLGSGR